MAFNKDILWVVGGNRMGKGQEGEFKVFRVGDGIDSENNCTVLCSSVAFSCCHRIQEPGWMCSSQSAYYFDNHINSELPQCESILLLAQLFK
jgi:hypothetical protein